MANKENKILDELRRRGTIFEDPRPKSESIIGKLIDLFLKKKSWIVKHSVWRRLETSATVR